MTTLCTTTAAYAANATPKQIEHWRQHGQVALPSPGQLHEHDARHLAVVAELVRHGLSVAEAEAVWRDHGARDDRLAIRREPSGKLRVAALDGVQPPPSPCFVVLDLAAVSAGVRRRIATLADPGRVVRLLRLRQVEAE